MDQYESNFDEVTKQKYGIYWTNLDLAYEIVSNLVDTFDEDFLIQSTEIFEQYKVKKFGWFDATGTLTGDFTFGVQESFPPLDTEIIYE